MIILDTRGHLVSTESAEELHTFARKIGLKRKWYQDHHAFFHHYDVTTPRKRKKAIRMGAVERTEKELFKNAWWYSDYKTKGRET